MADGSNANVFYVKETTNNTTPASPAWKTFPFSGFNIGTNQENIPSNNIKAGRFAGKPVKGRVQVGGDVNADFVDVHFDDFMESVACGTWTETDPGVSGIFELVTGDTRTSYSIGRDFTDLDTSTETNKSEIFTGVEVNTMSLSSSPDANVTCVFSMLGRGHGFFDALGGTNDLETVTMGTEFKTSGGSVSIDGVQTGEATELTINLTNNMEDVPTIASGDTSAQPSIGLTGVDGNFTVLFTDMTLYKKAVSGSPIAITWVITNGITNYTFHLPYLTLSGQPDISSPTNIPLPLSFEASFDDVAGYIMKVTRNAA